MRSSTRGWCVTGRMMTGSLTMVSVRVAPADWDEQWLIGSSSSSSSRVSCTVSESVAVCDSAPHVGAKDYIKYVDSTLS